MGMIKFISRVATRSITSSAKFKNKERDTSWLRHYMMESNNNTKVNSKGEHLNIKPSDIAHLKSVASAAIDKNATKLNDLSQEIWKNPELYFKEHIAHAVLTKFLEEDGFTVQRHYNMKTGFCARYQPHGDIHPNIAVLCEYDALPEIGHACGHNLIAEVGVGAGLGIKAAMENCGLHIGQLTVLGCPAEEEGGGKIYHINEGAFKNVDAALMSHPSNFSGVEANFSALQEVKVLYKGIPSHAACEPHSGVNALDAVVMAYNAISCLRQQMKPGCHVHGIITKGGSSPGIIPDEAELFYYIRAKTSLELDDLVTKVTACFEAAAVATGCKAHYWWDPHRYTEMISNKTMEELYRRNAELLNVEFTAEKDLPYFYGSTDMANVSHEVPSIHPHFFLGAKHPEHSREFAAQAGSAGAQTYAIREAKLLAHTAIDLLCSSDLMQKTKDEFTAVLQKQGAATNGSS